MTLLNPGALALLLLAIPIIAVHILKPQRREHIVGSTLIWERMERPVSSTLPWQRLRPSWLLALQLLALIAATLGLANPQRVEPAVLAKHTVFLIDASGSMAALDGTPDRMTDARSAANAVREELPAEGIASVIEVGAVPRVVLSSSDDPDEFSAAIRTVQATAGRADFAAAFALAEGLETPDSPIGFVLIGDGGLSEEELRAVPPGLTYEAIGSGSTNRAITDLDLIATQQGLTARITVVNTGGSATTQPVRFDVDGLTAETTQVELDRNQSAVGAVELPPGDRVEAFLDTEDLLMIDDRAWAVARRRAALDVFVVGERDPFLATALNAIDGVQATFSDSFDPDQVSDVVIFDRVAVPAKPGAPFFAIAAPSGLDEVRSVGQVEAPAVTLVQSDDGLLVNLDLTEVAIARAQQLELGPLTQTLIGAESAPLLVRGRQQDVSFIASTFVLSHSNLPLQVSFPILLDRILNELGASSLPPASIVVGDRITMPGGSATVTDPAGRAVQVPVAGLGPVADQPGFWTIEAGGQPAQTIAVNADPRESALAPAAAIPSELRSTQSGEEQRSTRSRRPWFLLVALAALVAEFLIARRRVGVAARQWRTSVVLRVITALALLVALFEPSLNRPTNRVASVFVIDASDSVDPTARAETDEWVQAAVATAPDEALVGVVFFGGDARIESLVQTDASFAAKTVVVDPTRTDLAAALRLGAAILPTDARRRVVLVSDGRATAGDVLDEATRLAESGVAVDTRLIGSATRVDAAVVSIDAPGTVQTGEAIPVRATAAVRGADAVVMELRRDDQVIASQQVAVEDGFATTRFVDDSPTDDALQRYSVRVVAVGDRVAENDVALAPVQVESARGVLLIDGGLGSAGAGPSATSVVAAALEAGGVDVTIEPPASITTSAELLAFQAIVLVDLNRRDLTDAQIAAIAGAVRSGGRGLVTIGGTSSYALGSYLGSDLEQLLPIVSDILDPQRRQTVAEVLAIDTSGSMGTCHCAEGQMGAARMNGGVNKTDVARAAAARTIAALGSTDEIGVISFDDDDRWVLDLAPVPDTEQMNEALGTLTPRGGTDIRTTLRTAGEQLRESSASLKHVILFSDGFTNPADLAEVAADAADLVEEGITVSVVATGEGAAEDLRQIAEAGQGRFYAGRNLARIPEIILEEALQASRDYVNEGEFFPLVTSRDDVVAALDASPPLLGYVATTAKPTARTLLRIGPDADPLLATWRVGLGQASSWTSDGGQRWAQQWANWQGGVDFWTRLVRDTFPNSQPDVLTTATVDGDVLRIEVDSATAFAHDAAAIARIAQADGTTREIGLNRVQDTTFSAEVTLDQVGVVTVGTSVTAADGSDILGTALTSRSYSEEYRLGGPDPQTLQAIAELTGGRTDIDAASAFDKADLAAATTSFDLTPWLLLLAVLAWPLAVVLSRWRRRSSVGVVPNPASIAPTPTWAGRSLRRRNQTTDAEADPAEATAEGSTDATTPTADRKATATQPKAPADTQPAAAQPPTNEPSANPQSWTEEKVPDPTKTDPTPPNPDAGGSALDALLDAKRRRDL